LGLLFNAYAWRIGMTVSEKIKARIAFLKTRISNLSEDYEDYSDGKIAAFEEDINFLIEMLDEIECKALKEEGYNV
jgi:hypothetical protein